MSRPEGVRVIRADGSVVPCELAPIGLDEDGMDTWEVATELANGDRIHVDVLPGKTSIVFPTKGTWRPR